MEIKGTFRVSASYSGVEFVPGKRGSAMLGNGNGNGNAKSAKRRRRRIIWISIVSLLVVGGGYGVTAALRPNHAIDPSKLATVERGDLARVVVATGKIQPLSTLERNKVDAEGPDVPFLKSNMERAENMYKDGLISKSLAEDAEKNYQLALNRQMSAQRNIAVSRAEMAKAEAQVSQSKAALERVEEDLRNSTIVSPIDGLVLSRDVNVGDAVSSILVLGSQATLLMTLGDVSEVYVQGRVDEADIGKVYLNQPARIVVESFKEKKFVGKVTKISPLGKEKDNVTTFEVRVSISNPGGELKANMSANAEILLEEKKNVLMAPEAAMIYDKDRNASIELPDAKAQNGKRKVAVKLGISNGVKTELLAGLNEGQQVILQ